MKTKLIEATQGKETGFNWGKFLVGRFDEEEWAHRSEILATSSSLLRNCGWANEHTVVMDLQTGEGAVFPPGGSAKADLDKHAVWVCPMFEPFLEWLYKQDLSDLDALPALVELPDAPPAMRGYRRDGPPRADRMSRNDRIAAHAIAVEIDKDPPPNGVDGAIAELLAKEVLVLRELLETDRGYDTYRDLDPRVRKLYMALNARARGDEKDMDEDPAEPWNRLVELAVAALARCIANGRWAVLEHRQADDLRDALLNGVDVGPIGERPPYDTDTGRPRAES